MELGRFNMGDNLLDLKYGKKGEKVALPLPCSICVCDNGKLRMHLSKPDVKVNGIGSRQLVLEIFVWSLIPGQFPLNVPLQVQFPPKRISGPFQTFFFFFLLYPTKQKQVLKWQVAESKGRLVLAQSCWHCRSLLCMVSIAKSSISFMLLTWKSMQALLLVSRSHETLDFPLHCALCSISGRKALSMLWATVLCCGTVAPAVPSPARLWAAARGGEQAEDSFC